MCVITLWSAPTVWAAPAEPTPGPGVSPCNPPAIGFCTEAQQLAIRLKEYVQGLDTDVIARPADEATAATVITVELVTSYIAYLDAVISGHTPNDTTLPVKVSDFRLIESMLMRQPGFPFIIINFKPADVYTETFDDDINEREIKYMAKDGDTSTSGRMIEKFLNAITTIIGLETCEQVVCNRKGDRVVAMLGGKGHLSSTKDSQYVDTGFRVTRFARSFLSDGRIAPIHYENIDNFAYDSLGVWAKDSYWGAIWEEDEFDQFSVRDAVFITGGRNPTKPMESGTWRGLAIGTQLSASASEMRVGRSEVTVNLDTSKVDVAITGITEGTSSTVQVGVDGGTTTISVADLSTLEWKGLPLSANGTFRDPRRYRGGVISTLDDVLGSILPPEGDNIKNTYRTIEGQFYGAAGEEVVGVFNKSGYVGSFGAYNK